MNAAEALKIANNSRQPAVKLEMDQTLERISEKASEGNLYTVVWLTYPETIAKLRDLGYEVTPHAHSYNFKVSWEQ